MVKLKTAFSLAEAIVAMIIIMTVSMCALPVLTKVKNGAGLNPAKMRGVYACYWKDGRLHQRACRERQCEDSTAAGNFCEFGGVMTAAEFYMIFSGGGGRVFSGQTKTKEFSYMVGEQPLILSPGLPGEPTSVYRDGNEDKALGGGSSKKIAELHDNIKSCEFLLRYGFSGCPSDDTCVNPSRKINSCSVEKTDGVFVLKLNGCECYQYNYGDDTNPSYDGYKPEASYIRLSDLREVSYNKDRIKDYLTNASGNANTYTPNGVNENDLSFNLTLHDSSLDYNRTTSHMSEILANISALRKNELIDSIIKQNPGAPGVPGAVVILW